MPRRRRRRGRRRSPAQIFVSLGLALTLGVCLILWRVYSWHWLFAYLLGINLATILLYGYDKLAARSDWGRVPETVLHGFAFLGGTPGAVLAQNAFRHKTVKSKFRRAFWVLTTLQVALIGWALWYFWPTNGEG